MNAQKAKESGQLIPTTKAVHKTNRPMKIETDGILDLKKGSTILDSGGSDSPKTTGHTTAKQWDDWDIVGLPGEELLSASVRALLVSS
jgi:transcriptional adapter 2-alpha